MSTVQEESLFWKAIEVSNPYKNSDWSEYSIGGHLESLTQYLTKFDDAQLIDFERVLQLKLATLYTAEIAELCVILECDFEKNGDAYDFDLYLSDDGFIYFRCWLILKGQTFFDDILQDLQSFVSDQYHFDIGDTWAEGLLYVADEAANIIHKTENETPIRDAVYELYPENHYDFSSGDIDRELLNGLALKTRYPKLVTEICELRSE